MRVSVLTRSWPLFTVVIIGQLADLATFMMAVARVGIGAEQNVLVRALYGQFGASGPLVLKLLALATVLPLLWYVGYRWPSRLLGAVLVSVLIAVVGVYGNIAHGIVG